MDENLEEESQIMDEQNEESKPLSSDTFKADISNLKLPPIKSIPATSTIKNAVDIMQKLRIGSVLIVDKDNKIEGIVTERDILLKVIGIIDDIANTLITEVMTPEPECLQKEDMICFAIHNMHVGGYRHVPIVDEEDHPVAMVSIKDVMHYIFDHFPEDIINITSQPYRGPVSREGA
jgi:CBS domain-containing protein